MVRGSVSVDDQKIGARIRKGRLQRGFSQTELGNSLDLSFQQVQKYEKGTNHVSAVRLCQIARLLGVSTEFLLEGIELPAVKDQRRQAIFSADELVHSAQALALLTAFNRIRKGPIRRKCLALVQAIADET
ncbi:MAG: helix-turn-helix transcriptional regulator [Alphaproteobacteria bacterium]|nr:helix-turn-helix transcriptional regulator [Alphaproteobacteria bacterium]MBV9695218.1 helix-turn-helix transcriptional regulator [Alphaproteobacteria bacterium]